MKNDEQNKPEELCIPVDNLLRNFNEKEKELANQILTDIFSDTEDKPDDFK